MSVCCCYYFVTVHHHHYYYYQLFYVWLRFVFCKKKNKIKSHWMTTMMMYHQTYLNNTKKTKQNTCWFSNHNKLVVHSKLMIINGWKITHHTQTQTWIDDDDEIWCVFFLFNFWLINQLYTRHRKTNTTFFFFFLDHNHNHLWWHVKHECTCVCVYVNEFQLTIIKLLKWWK